MLRMAGKLSGFRSKKYSGGSPGVNSSHSSSTFSMVSARTSLPSLDTVSRVTCHVSRVTRLHLVAGKTARMSRVAMNLSPPTSRITVLLSLASAASLLLTPGTWRRDIVTRDT